MCCSSVPSRNSSSSMCASTPWRRWWPAGSSSKLCRVLQVPYIILTSSVQQQDKCFLNSLGRGFYNMLIKRLIVTVSIMLHEGRRFIGSQPQGNSFLKEGIHCFCSLHPASTNITQILPLYQNIRTAKTSYILFFNSTRKSSMTWHFPVLLRVVTENIGHNSHPCRSYEILGPPL